MEKRINFTAIRKKAEMLREIYPSGTEVELIYMEDKFAPPTGTKGKVIMVDDMAQIHVKWENGSTLALVNGVDSWRRI